MGNRIDIRDEPAKSIFLDAQEIASPDASGGLPRPPVRGRSTASAAKSRHSCATTSSSGITWSTRPAIPARRRTSPAIRAPKAPAR